MDVNSFVTVVGSLGFPIAACGFLAWYMSTSLKEFRHTIEENTKLVQELIILVKERSVKIERQEKDVRD